MAKAHQSLEKSQVSSSDDIENRILYTNPVLEAFGNAKTIRNDNSSRFGKFIELFFEENNNIYSAKITSYLLEKSRIVTQQENERNYHIFHMLAKSAPDDIKDKLHLDMDTKWNYLNDNYERFEDFIEKDTDNYQEMLDCMTGLKFTDSEQREIFDIVGAVLHLGQVNFVPNKDGSDINKDSNHYIHSAKLFGVEASHVRDLCCQRVIKQPGTTKLIQIDVDVDGAKINRDTLAKMVYDSLFTWLVDRVNQSITKKFKKPERCYKSIGLLDIFGFEIFKDNSFEQLCINYTNEKLQQHFNQHMFKIEQQEYEKERVQWSHIEFVDNAACIEMLEGRTSSIFSLLDEQCKIASKDTAEADKKL